MKNQFSLNSFFLLAFLLIMISSCEESPTSSPRYVDISGKILNSNNEAIQNAVISAIDRFGKIESSDTTNDNGEFTLMQMPFENSGYKIRVVHEDYEMFQSTISEVINEDYDPSNPILNLTLQDEEEEKEEECCNSYNIIVNDNDGNPLKGVEVLVRLSLEDKLDKGNTNEEGTFLTSEICADTFEIRYFLDGYEVVEELYTYDNNCDTINIEINLIKKEIEEEECCDAQIKVYPYDEDGNIIENAKVRLWKNGDMVAYAYSENGYAELEDICKGNYWIDIIAEGYDDIEFEVSIDCAEELEYNKTLQTIEKEECCNSWIKIIPRDKETEKIIEGATVSLWKDGEKVAEISMKEGDEYAKLLEVCNGNYTVLVSAEGYTALDFELEIKCKTEFQETIRLSKK